MKKLHQAMKKKLESGKKILHSYRKYRFRKDLKYNLKVLATRIRIWKKIVVKSNLSLKNSVLSAIK